MRVSSGGLSGDRGVSAHLDETIGGDLPAVSCDTLGDVQVSQLAEVAKVFDHRGRHPHAPEALVFAKTDGRGGRALRRTCVMRKEGGGGVNEGWRGQTKARGRVSNGEVATGVGHLESLRWADHNRAM